MNQRQHETLFKATFEDSLMKSSSYLDNLYTHIVLSGKSISPAMFSMLLNMVKIIDTKFFKIVKTLSKSFSAMSFNHPLLVGKYFLSEEFFQQFVNLNKMIRELWMLRKDYPNQLQEWKMKHRQIFHLNAKGRHKKTHLICVARHRVTSRFSREKHILLELV